ncbi:MAG: OmpH family outer membrane protein [Magnetococcales bacterium]|nr:OmpH family outer membrane protein [Magnetococcales bacterium]NGZ25679.1 OmpH family outer membrane protein [Magnetococcales bacterium]
MIKWLMLLFIVLSLQGNSVDAEEVKIAYVDVPRAIASSEAAKRARELMQKKLDSKQREVDAVEEEIKLLKEEKLREEKEQPEGTLKPEGRSEIANALSKKLREYQRLVEENQAALDRENGVWTKKVTDALRQVIQEIGREDGYTVIVGKGQVLYSTSSIDITDKVLIRLNETTRRWY